MTKWRTTGPRAGIVRGKTPFDTVAMVRSRVATGVLCGKVLSLLSLQVNKEILGGQDASRCRTTGHHFRANVQRRTEPFVAVHYLFCFAPWMNHWTFYSLTLPLLQARLD